MTVKKYAQMRRDCSLAFKSLYASVFAISIIILKAPVSAQIDTVFVRSDVYPGEGALNAAVKDVISAGHLFNTVFKLEPNGYYVLTSTITVPAGDHLTIVAPAPGNTQETAPPQILWTSSQNVDTQFNFDCYGDITLENIWLYYANTDGQQIRSSLQIQDDPAANASGKGERGCFDGVIFDYAACPQNASGAVGITAKHFKGTFKNCYFRNCIDPHFSYYGRAVSFPFDSPGWHIDSLLFEHCTFANIGYVYMQEAGNYGDHVHFNHCTFLNVLMFSLESGWWYKMSVTNSLWVNGFMIGHVPAMFGSSEPFGGTIRIDSVSNFGFNVPFGDQDRRILFANNSYYIEPWLRDWMDHNPYSIELRERGASEQIPVPQPMLSQETLAFFEASEFPYMNKAQLYDDTDPCFVQPPTNVEALKQFLFYKWGTCNDTNWAYLPDVSAQHEWPLKENLAYSNDTLLSAGMAGFPLGDLYHWFPNEYQQWKNQANAEYARIFHWLNTGRDSIFTAIKHHQPDFGDWRRSFHSHAYPNPFNQLIHIRYTVPQSCYVSLQVFNLQGQPVATLDEGERNAGDYAITFDGSGLASGVYFFQLKANEFIETKKLVLLK